MSEGLEELPLFAINTVLFPRANLVLHVFEERYLEMVRRCEEEDRPFGIVLIRSGEEVGDTPEPYLVGTTAHVDQTFAYDDGRLDLRITGERRFRIRELDESGPYLVGKVEPVVEAGLDDSAHTRQVVRDARDELTRFIQSQFASEEFSVHVQLSPDPLALSFTIASFLPLDNLDRQRLLESTDTIERLEELLPLLQAQVYEMGPTVEYPLPDLDRPNWITPN